MGPSGILCPGTAGHWAVSTCGTKEGTDARAAGVAADLKVPAVVQGLGGCWSSCLRSHTDVHLPQVLCLYPETKAPRRDCPSGEKLQAAGGAGGHAQTTWDPHQWLQGSCREPPPCETRGMVSAVPEAD